MLQGGDFTAGNGTGQSFLTLALSVLSTKWTTGGESIYGRTFEDEKCV